MKKQFFILLIIIFALIVVGFFLNYEVKAVTTCGQAVSYGGQSYDTVQIGTQCWFKENLNVGTMIGNLETPDNTAPTPNNPSTAQKWCYDSSSTNCANEGGLYSWAEANGLANSCNSTSCSVSTPNQGICPVGWHIPTDAEFYTLENYLKTPGQSCDPARTEWGCSGAGTKLVYGGSSGFDAIRAGNHETNGNLSQFDKREPSVHFWSSSPCLNCSNYGHSYNRALVYSSAPDGLVSRGWSWNVHGFSVRCLADSITTTPSCTAWTYSDWSTCSASGQQTRTVISSLPSGCAGGSPVLSQSCTYVPPACTSWTYSNWGACSSSGQQTRTVTSSSPSGCSGSSPVITQSCSYTAPTCTSWTYSGWGACSSGGQQTRTVMSSSPSGCNGGSPILNQSCTPSTTTCTSWTYSNWGVCSSSGQQTRTVASSSPSGCSGGSPIISQACTFDSSKISPTITSLTPQAIEPGDVITISGSNFGDVQGYSKLIVGGSESVAGVITSWTYKEIKYRTSPTADAMSKKIGIKKCSSYSICLNPVYAGYYYIQPIIDSLDKLSGAVGDVVAIYGKNLKSSNIDSDDSGSSYTVKVYINTTEVVVSSWENSEVQFTIPYGASSGYVKVEVYDKGTPNKVVAMGPYFKILGSNTSLISKDTYAEKQTYLSQINMPSVWAMGIPQKKVIVAIIDDGVYTNHEDYVGSADFWVNKDETPNNGIDDDKNGYIDDSIGWDFAYNTKDLYPSGTHGTMVAGLIKATKDNNKGIAGINQNAIIMPLIVFKNAKDGGGATKEAIIKAIKYAADNDAEVINLSLGSNQYSGIVNYTDAFNEAIIYANSKGAIIIVAAGNGDDFLQGANLNVTPDSPVCNDNGNNMVIGVGAVDTNNNRTSWSNYGNNCVDIWAPGENIISTAIQNSTVTIDKFWGDGWYLEEDGTSFAAPIVAGVVSLLKAKYPNITSSEVVGILKNNSNNGIIDAYRVLTASYSAPVPSPNTSGDATGGKKVVEEEKKLITKIDNNLSKRVSGNILLQVEKNGEGWYVYPDDKKKYYLGRPADAFSIMRNLGLGIKHSELAGYLNIKFPSRLSGKIVLDVEQNGEAYYVNPKDLKGYFLSRPADAFKVMRNLGLGITNADIRKIGVGEIK